MHFPLSTIATTALILAATDALPHRPHSQGKGRFTRLPSGSFPFGFPTDGALFPTGVFPSRIPTNGAPFPSGGLPTAISSVPVPTGAPSFPSGLPDVSSISFQLPGTLNENVVAAASKTSATSSVPTGNSTTGGVSASATTTFPEAAGESTLSEPMTVTGAFDGGLVRFGRGVTCGGQSEGGDSDAVFLVEDGGSVSNVIIGADQGEGIHCLGACTIENVWWEAVCEDALTLKGTGSGTSYVIGGGAKGASDKVFQHNSGGILNIKGFYVADFGKLYRSCGNCGKMFERHVVLDGVIAHGGSATVVGINTNYGDTATITNSCITNIDPVCTEFEGNDTGDEPTKLNTGISSSCKYTEAAIAAC